jgi:hypothetical protein
VKKALEAGVDIICAQGGEGTSALVMQMSNQLILVQVEDTLETLQRAF